MFAAPRPAYSTVHPTDTRARAGHPHALALDPTAAVRVRAVRAHPRAPHTATRRVLGGHELPSRAPLRPSQHARSTSSTRARGAADGHGAALDDREAAARLSAALAEEVVGLVGLLRTCGGKQRRSADRTPSVRPRRPAATTTSLWRLQAPPPRPHRAARTRAIDRTLVRTCPAREGCSRRTERSARWRRVWQRGEVGVRMRPGEGERTAMSGRGWGWRT